MALALQASDLKPPPVFVQGMCNIAAVLLYVMPELDAFYCFKKLYCSEFRLLGVEEFQGKGIALKVRVEHVAASQANIIVTSMQCRDIALV